MEKNKSLPNFNQTKNWIAHNENVNSINYAINTRSIMNKNYMNIHRKEQKIINKVEDMFNSYEKISNKNMNELGNLKQMNQEFFSKFKETRIKFKNKGRKLNFVETFGEIIEKYKEKGYKIKDFSVKNNLFKHSTLLQEPNKILLNLNSPEDIHELDKDMSYLNKINNQTHRILKNIKSNLTPSQTPEKILEKKEENIEILKENIIRDEELIKKAKETIESNKDFFIFENKDSNLPSNRTHFHSRNIKSLSKSICESKDLDNQKTHITSKVSILAGDKSTKISFKSIKSLGNFHINNNPDKKNSTFKKSIKKDYSSLRIPIFPKVTFNNESFLTTNQKTMRILKNTHEINPKKEVIIKEIDSKINNFKNKQLDSVYEKAVGNDDMNQILDYLSLSKANKEQFIENLKKKILPRDIIKNITKIKTKVNELDINRVYETFTAKTGNFDINENNLEKIRMLDSKISQLDYRYLKKLNKYVGEDELPKIKK